VALSLRSRELLALTAVVLLVVAVMTLAHLASVAQITLTGASEEGRLLARQLFHQASRIVVVGGAPIPDGLRSDPAVRALLEGMVGYSRVVVYAGVVDPAGRVVVHSDPTLEGRTLGPHATLEEVLSAGPARMLRVLLADPQIYEVRVPVRRGERPFAEIRVGISTSLVRQELRAALVRSLALGGAALAVAIAVGLGAGRVLLQSLRHIARRVERLARGEFGAPVELKQGEDMGALAERVNRLGERMQEDGAPAGPGGGAGGSTIDRLEDAVLVVNAERELVFLNQAAERVLDLRLEAATGQPLGALLPSGHPLLEVEAQLFEEGQTARNRPVTLDEPRGGARELAVSSYRLREADQPGGAVLLLKDLEPVRTVESIVTYSQKLAALGRLTSGVAHEVKNPLNAMRIHLELLRSRLGSDRPDVADNVDVIGESLQRLDRVVQGFLRFMRPQDLRVQALDPRLLLDDAARAAEPEALAAGVALVVDSPDGLGALAADRELMGQALANLVVNAIQSMPRGGTVTLSARSAPGESVLIRVTDEGEGIPPEELDQIFRLYYTTKTGGSGIGLSLVYRIVQMHDGQIDVDSTVGKGTTITLTLPRAGT